MPWLMVSQRCRCKVVDASPAAYLTGEWRFGVKINDGKCYSHEGCHTRKRVDLGVNQSFGPWDGR
jgi:hypothetical protein